MKSIKEFITALNLTEAVVIIAETEQEQDALVYLGTSHVVANLALSLGWNVCPRIDGSLLIVMT